MSDNEQSAAIAMMKAVYEDGKAEINDTEYVFNSMTHKKRRAVFAYYTTVAAQLQSGQFGFMDTPEFERIEQIISDHVTVDGSLLSKKSDHWDNHPGDYIMFIASALGAMSYPFLAGSRTA